MQFVRFDDVSAFSARVLPVLMENEAANNLMLGIIERGIRMQMADEWLMAAVETAQGRIALITLMTPPHNLLIAQGESQTTDEALDTLVEALQSEKIAIPGLLAEKTLARRFAARYEAKIGGTFTVDMEERIYELRAVSAGRRVGTLRQATEKDMHFLPYWLGGFHADALGAACTVEIEAAQKHLERGSLYVLEDEGMPVCIAGAARKMPHGRSLGPVYTPPFLRCRGYATSCVAQLSQKLLDEGNDYCALFTDLSNPASNGAYMKVGYQPIADCTQMRYREAGLQDA